MTCPMSHGLVSLTCKMGLWEYLVPRVALLEVSQTELEVSFLGGSARIMRITDLGQVSGEVQR